MRVVEAESWWTDYWKDHELRPKYFNVVARQLNDPPQWHQGRIWVLVKYLCRGGERSRKYPVTTIRWPRDIGG